MKIMVSACLLGQKCKYDGGDNYSEKVIAFTEGHEVIPVCPEMAGGLPAPRIPCEIVNGTVMNRSGENKDREFREGAEKCLKLAKEKGIDLAVLQPPHQIDVPDGHPVHLALINELEQLGILDAAIHRIDAPGQQHDQKNKRRDHRDIADQAARHFTQIRILLSRIGNKSKKENKILYHKQAWLDNHFSSVL